MCSDFSLRASSRLAVVGDGLSSENSCSVPFSHFNALLHQRYRLLKPLGQGGFGRTFLACDEQQSTKFFCVVKQLLCNGYHPQATELFRQKAQRLAEISEHPQIPQLLNHFEQDGQLFIVQEWIDGSTLEQEALEQPFGEEDVWMLLRELLPVLHYLHDRNIIHRDIKPANIIRRCKRDADRHAHLFVLVDFGAAKQVGDVSSETVIGSAEYAAPEQIRGRAVFASDLYSLGVTCLHLLTRISPFDLYDVGDAMWKWEAYLMQPVSAALKHMLCTLVQPALRRRYQSAAEALAALEASSQQMNQSTLPVATPVPFTSARMDSCTIRNGTSAEILPAAIAASHAIQRVRSITAATVYNPLTQRWYSFPSEAVPNDIAYHVALFLRDHVTHTPDPYKAKQASPTTCHFVTPKQSLMGWCLVAVGLGTVAASVALTCLWLCASIIFLALAMPPQSTAMPAKTTSSALSR